MTSLKNHKPSGRHYPMSEADAVKAQGAPSMGGSMGAPTMGGAMGMGAMGMGTMGGKEKS